MLHSSFEQTIRPQTESERLRHTSFSLLFVFLEIWLWIPLLTRRKRRVPHVSRVRDTGTKNPCSSDVHSSQISPRQGPGAPQVCSSMRHHKSAAPRFVLFEAWAFLLFGIKRFAPCSIRAAPSGFFPVRLQPARPVLAKPTPALLPARPLCRITVESYSVSSTHGADRLNHCCKK